jgi:ornithine carbamoyltransferase
MYDGIEYRGYDQSIVKTFARYAGVPVWNGLTDQAHPTQVLADLLTMQEHGRKPFSEMRVCFLGDAEDNVATSLTLGAAILGIDMRLAAPRACWPAEGLTARALGMTEKAGGALMVTDQLATAVKDCDFLYTDVWVSMGEPDEKWGERIRLLQPYQVNRAVLDMTGNAGTRFMHCLPAFHNTETAVGRDIQAKFGIDAMEVTEEVFESPASIVFDQAENRLHTIKAVMVATAG